METYVYYNPAKIVFGKDSIDKIGGLLRENNARSVLMVYGGDYIVSLGIFEKVKTACEKLGIDFAYKSGVVPNPEVRFVREMIEICREKKVDFIIAAGGGSAMDTAKAIAIGVNYEGDVWDFFTKDVEVKDVVPVGVVVTVPASGSEASAATIISNGEYKLGFEHEEIIPKFAILNPEYTLTLPPHPTACGMADMLSHMLERYFSPTKKTDTTDYLIEATIKSLWLNARRVKENPQDLDARSEIMQIANIAHNDSLGMGRESCWGSHRIEHEISAIYGIAHGEGMAIVFLAFVKYMAENKPERMAQLSNRVFGYDYHNYSKRDLALLLAEELERFYKMIGLRTTLSELDIDDSRFEEMASKATKGNKMKVGHYMPLDKERIVEILKLAL